MTLIPTLVTERLVLRAPQLDGLDIYVAFSGVSDTVVGKYRGGQTLEEVRKNLQEDIANWGKGFGMWLLTLSNGEVIGGAGLSHPDDWPSHELTWWLMPKHRGNGYATEASLAVIEFGYGALGWPAVETHMRDENIPARRLAERLGGKVIRRDMFPDGILRDVFLFPRQMQEAVQ